MMKIDVLWKELEDDTSFSHGLLIRRYSGEVLPDVFVALKSPERFRCIAASISNSHGINISLFSNLREISVEIVPDDTRQERSFLLFKLLDNQHKDIFSVLCEDLISRVSSLTKEELIIKELINRFEKWKSLFDKAGATGLSPEEQRGLYGELYFLRRILNTSSDSFKIVNYWNGPAREVRDFQVGTHAVEVKTTHGNNHQKIQISSERQLDISNFENLFLYHLSLEVRHNDGETLNQIIDSISTTLSSDYPAQTKFNNKLLEVGFFNHHRSKYEEIGYFIRQGNYYDVKGNFPRLEERDIRTGVGDVEYSIILDHCQKYLTTEEVVLTKLTKP